MLLVLSDQFDTHADTVLAKLEGEIDYFRLNLDVRSLRESYVSFLGEDWKLETKNRSIQTSQITSVWCRRAFVELLLEEQNIQSADFKIWKNEWNSALSGIYLAIKNRPWLNPLAAAFRGENKYYQMQLAKEIGLKMPSTLVSNCKKEILDFATIHNDDLILKSMAQELYDCGENGLKGLYANRLSSQKLEAFGKTDENPIFLQPYVKKLYEVRYTVVDEEHLVCKIDSQSSKIACEDWRRYDLAHTPHSQIEPPCEIKERVTQLLERLEIHYGALDFIVTTDNEWIFLEINCMGQWLWIEELSGLDISGAIVRWIKNNEKGDKHLKA